MKWASKAILKNNCHFDQILTKLFGQAGASQTELENNGVDKDDIFLFLDGLKNMLTMVIIYIIFWLASD